MSDEFKVDLSELEGTLRSLNRLYEDMSAVHGHSVYQTNLSEGALGHTGMFVEARELSRSHTEMKAHLEDVMRVLKELIDEFRTKAMHIHGKYQDAEYEAKHGFSHAGAHQASSGGSATQHADEGSQQGMTG